MKKYFAAGLIILLPLALTIAIVIFIVNFLTKPFVGLVNGILGHFSLMENGFLFLTGQELEYYGTQLLILVFLFGFTLLLGVIARLFLFHYLFVLGEYILHRIPFINVLYKTSQDVIRTIFSSNTESFKQVVLLPFPTKDSYSIGFITRDSLPGLLSEKFVSVFVPTTPNPTSGFLLMVKREDLIFLDIKVEEALKYVISCGVVFPSFKAVKKDQDVQDKQDVQDVISVV